MKPFRVAAVPMISEPGSPSANAARITAYISRAAAEGAGLVLFPECSLTGYTTAGAANHALRPDDPLIEGLANAARAAGIAVCLGLIERTDRLPFLSQLLIDDGRVTVYRKTHLGSREAACFQAGDRFPVATARGTLVCGIQLCWESHIPEISSALRAQGAELLLVPYASGMGGERCRENWAVHLPARASDNGVFVLACNALRTGSDGKLCGGGIAAYDPKGRCIADYYGPDEHLLLCDLDGPLPRELPEGDMHKISYFDRRRRDLFP